MLYKNVIFDLGGVLLDWNPRQFVQELNLPAHFVEVFQSLLWAMHDGGLLTREELVAKLPSQYDRGVFADCVRQIAPKLYLIEEMHEIFHEVRGSGYRIYILSNMPKEMHEELMQLHDFFQLPEGQVYSYEVKAIKPQPQIYEALLNRYQLKGPESIFIDDREENVVAASKFGIDGILCQSPAQVRQELVKRGLLKK